MVVYDQVDGWLSFYSVASAIYELQRPGSWSDGYRDHKVELFQTVMAGALYNRGTANYRGRLSAGSNITTLVLQWQKCVHHIVAFRI